MNCKSKELSDISKILHTREEFIKLFKRKIFLHGKNYIYVKNVGKIAIKEK